MKKTIRIVLIVVVILFIGVMFFAGQLVKQSVNKLGPAVLGVDVSVGNVIVLPLRGLIRINDLVVGNPEGFKTDSLFKMTRLNIDIKMSSIFSDTIIVKDITVIGPEITYEKTLTDSNVSALEKKLGGDNAKKPETEKPDDTAGKEGGKKVIIEHFALNEGQINLSLPGMMGSAIPIPLPALEMKDIGKDEDNSGASLTDVIGEIFSTIFSSVGKAVTSSGKLLGDGAKAVGEGAMAAGGLAVDGVSAVGGAVGDAGKAIGKGVASLFGGGSDEEKSEKVSETPPSGE